MKHLNERSDYIFRDVCHIDSPLRRTTPESAILYHSLKEITYQTHITEITYIQRVITENTT